MRKLRPAVETLSRTVLLGALVVAIVLLLWSTKYAGLSDARAMALASLARNLAQGRGFVTGSFTPLSLHFVPRTTNHPELVIMPVYPFLLSLLFRVWEASDAVVASLSVVFFFLSLIGLYFLARKWFDYPIAVTTLLVTAMHFLMLEQAAQGLESSFVVCLALLLFYVLASDLQRPPSRDSSVAPPSLLRPCVFTAFLLGIAVLTRFEMLAYAPVVWVYWFWRARSRPDASLEPDARARLSWRLTAWYWAIFLLVLAPWVVRCTVITKHPMLTLRGYEIIMATGHWPGQSLYRSFTAIPSFPTVAALVSPGTMVGKLHRAVRFTYRTLPGIANPYILAIFIGGFLLSTRLWQDAQIRWWLVLILVAQILFMCLYVPFGETIAPLLPLIVMFAAATMSKAVRNAFGDSHRLQFRRGVVEGLALGALVLVVAYPLADLLFVQPAAEKSVVPRLVTEASAGGRLVASDIPQAVAWYARRPAMLFVHHPNDYYNLRQAGLVPDTVFLSPFLLRYPPEELVAFWQRLVISPTAFAGYVPDKSWRGPGGRWRWKGAAGAEGAPAIEPGEVEPPAVAVPEEGGHELPGPGAP
jgi:hypothetical protein